MKYQEFRKDVESQFRDLAASTAPPKCEAEKAELRVLEQKLETVQASLAEAIAKVAEAGLSEYEASLSEAMTAVGSASKQAAAAGSAAPSGGAGSADPFHSVASGLMQIQQLAADAALYATGITDRGSDSSASALVGLLGPLGSKLGPLPETGMLVLSHAGEAFHKGSAFVSGLSPTLADAVARVLEFMFLQLGNVNELCDSAVKRFLEAYPEHQSPFLSESPMGAIGVIFAVLSLLVLDALVALRWIAKCGCALLCCRLCRRRHGTDIAAPVAVAPTVESQSATPSRSSTAPASAAAAKPRSGPAREPGQEALRKAAAAAGAENRLDDQAENAAEEREDVRGSRGEAARDADGPPAKAAAAAARSDEERTEGANDGAAEAAEEIPEGNADQVAAGETPEKADWGAEDAERVTEEGPVAERSGTEGSEPASQRVSGEESKTNDSAESHEG